MYSNAFHAENATPLPDGWPFRANSPVTIQPEVKAKWIQALRSGEYRQGRNSLHQIDPHGDRLCCLGVACILYKKNGDPHGELTVSDDHLDTAVWYGGERGYLPSVVKEWLTSEDSDLSIPSNPDFFVTWPPDDRAYLHTVAFTLTELNDAGFTFDMMADVIDYFF